MPAPPLPIGAAGVVNTTFTNVASVVIPVTGAGLELLRLSVTNGEGNPVTITIYDSASLPTSSSLPVPLLNTWTPVPPTPAAAAALPGGNAPWTYSPLQLPAGAGGPTIAPGATWTCSGSPDSLLFANGLCVVLGLASAKQPWLPGTFTSGGIVVASYWQG